MMVVVSTIKLDKGIDWAIPIRSPGNAITRKVQTDFKCWKRQL